MDPEQEHDGFVAVEARASSHAAADKDDNMDMDVDTDTDMDVIGADDIHTYNPANILPQPPEVLQQIRKWLDPTPYDHEGGEYRRHLASHAPGTGQWLTDSETYQKWHAAGAADAAASHGLLWIRGIPGSGKSVFAAMLADALAREGHPVLFFFFRQIIDANHEPVQMLRDWLAQLLDHSPPLQRDLAALVELGHRPVKSLGNDELWALLRTGLAHLPRVYLVADALDEMRRGNEDWLRALAGAAMWDPARVKVLITSRPVDRVEAPLRGFPMLRIRLEEHLVDTDIAKYVQLRLARADAAAAMPAQDRALIEEAVPGRANGLFLYAKLAMDGFLAPGAHIGHVLAKLPADLNAMYTNLLAEHARTSGVSPDTQRLLLCWVTHASRPLRLLEMAEMLATACSRPEGEAANRLDRKSARALVRAACGPLLQIHPDETVSVVHHSLTEFLLGVTRPVEEEAPESSSSASSSSFPIPILMPGPSHEQLALSCIHYLQSSGCWEPADTSDATADYDNDYSEGWALARPERMRKAAVRLRFPFAEYASRNWAIHAAKSSDAGPVSLDLIGALDGFLVRGERLDSWLELAWGRGAGTAEPGCIAAHYGLAFYLEHLIRREGADVATRKANRCQPPLMYAAAAGQAAAVQVLLAAGAPPETEDRVGSTPLHRAAANNHASVVTLLVAAGASPLKKTKREPWGSGRCGRAAITIGSTPLMLACRAGHFAVIDALLPWLNEAGAFPLALKWTTLAGQANLLKHLLQQPGVDVNAPVHGDTPLFNACRCGDVESIEALVLAGADAAVVCPGNTDPYTYLEARSLDSRDMSPLAVFCAAGYHRIRREDHAEAAMKRVVELLLQAGADLNARDGCGRTPLHCATGQPALMRFLLRAGADADAETQDGGTLLHRLLSGYRPQHTTLSLWDDIELLVGEAHADVNKRRRSDGKTPIMLMTGSYPYYELDLCLRFVKAFTPDCTIADEAGDTPLHIFARCPSDGEGGRPGEREAVLDALLAAGAQINQRNRDGRTALHVANSASVIDCLVGHGADLEARDNSGSTPLLLSCSRPSPSWDVMVHLLSIGARPDTRDFAGRTLLHAALGPQDMADSLRHVFGLQLGLHRNEADYAGNTVLHELVSEKAGEADRKQAFGVLLRRGVDPDATNHAGETVLHLACARASASIQDLVTDALAACSPETRELPDHGGQRPIHLAAGTCFETVAQLVGGGVDITAPTHQGLTPLHIAASAGQQSVLAMLLSEISRGSGRCGPLDHAPAARAAIIDAVDHSGLTPLYYACLSGQPEAVRLLLNAGSQVRPHSKQLLDACSRVEHEAAQRSTKRPPVESWKARDYHREVDRPDTFAWLASPDRAERIHAGLDEILALLASHGLDHAGTAEKGGRTHLDAAIAAVPDGSGAAYVLRCFSRFKVTFVRPEDDCNEGRDAGQDDGDDGPGAGQDESGDGAAAAAAAAAAQALTAFIDRCAEIRNTAATIAFGEQNLVPHVLADEGVQERLFVQLLAQREFDLVHSVATAARASSACRPNESGWTLLHALVALGQAQLLSRLATPDDIARIDSPAWRADQQALARKDGSARNIWRGPIAPLVLAACRREEPNMIVLGVLVDEAGASVNAAEMVELHPGEGYVPGSTALHALAQAKHWWQAHEALPFVLARRPDLEARDAWGKTPLHCAIVNCIRFRHHVVGQLIEAGADVNAVADTSKPKVSSWEDEMEAHDCVGMAAAVGDTYLLELLIARGARVNAGAVMAAIHKEHIGGLKVLLAAHETPTAEVRESEPSRRRPPSYLEGECGARAVHLAAILEYHRETHEPLVDMVRLLLASGVDPFGTWRLLEHRDDVEMDESGQPRTLLHQILRQNGIVGPFFELASLDLEHRDRVGQTVLLAACANPLTFTSTITIRRPSSPTPKGEEERGNDDDEDGRDHHDEHHKLIPYLLARGASPVALDSQSRSALHLAITAPAPSHDQPADLADLTSLAAPLMLPSVINHACASGATPLHVALTVPAKTSHCPTSWQPLHEPLIAALLAAGADPHHVNPHTGDGALHLVGQAVGRCGAPISLMRELAGLGLDVNARNLRGETPVFGVVLGGGDRGRKWGQGWGDEEGEEEVWRVLAELGVDFGVRDGEGRGLLHVAAAKGKYWVGVYKRLLGMGLDAAAVDGKQRTSLDVAAACQNEAVLGLFEREERGVSGRV